MTATEVPPSQTTRWRAVVRVLRSPFDSLSCALLPAPCSLCGSLLPRLSSVPICDVCWSEIPRQPEYVCVRCGDELEGPAGADRSGVCRACRLASPPFHRAVSYGVYRGRMRDAIHALKYDRLHAASAGLGRMLAQAIAELCGEASAEMLVVPVPLHPLKFAQRGFNQSRSLAAAALKFLRKSHPEWRLTLAAGTLLRQRATATQAGLTPRQRRLNVRGAFVVSDPERVTARHVLIVDDILTTGATARAAAKALMDGGAASVCVATLARAHRAAGFGTRSEYGGAEEEIPLAGPAPEAGLFSANSSTFGSTTQKQPSF